MIRLSLRCQLACLVVASALAVAPLARAQQFSELMQQAEVMRTYTETMQRISDTAKDPTTSAVAAVIAATEMLKPSGADHAIDFLNRMLNDSKDPAVKRAIRFQLAEQYKASGKQDSALEQYRLIITGG